MQRAQHSIRRNAASGALMKLRNLLLPRYTAPAGLIPYGLTWVYGGGVFNPRLHAAPMSSLISQGRCDITDSRAKLRQNDVLNDACQSTGNTGPKTKTARPEGIQLAQRS
jgi:hypothetical protein